jgi:methyl-accepting chemotaxis protein
MKCAWESKVGEAISNLASKAGLGLSEFRGMAENSPVNIMFCDLDFNIVYLNPKSATTLRTLEKHLPVPVEKIQGGSIDVFHKSPLHQRRILSNDKNLPHRATISVGPEKLDLLVSAIYDHTGKYIGAMVTWDVITQRLAQEQNLARIQSMMDNIPINVMMADKDGNILYINPRSRETLKSIEKDLPIPVDRIVGSSFDVFHRNPAVQRKIVADDRNLPHAAHIKVRPNTLSLLASATYDANNNYIGPMVTWELITDRLVLIENVTAAAQQLAAAAELNATATQLSGNAEKSTTVSQSTAAASEEVAAGVRTVATNTEEMSMSIKEIARNAAEASATSSTTLKQAFETNQTIMKLGESSREIGNVIKVITSIAQQTNLLALNATIEAARAGDAERGFAVVANEVKELAKQTAKATEDITAKITGIQKDSGGAVDAVADISKMIEKLNSIAGAIAASVEEQSATTNEVARVVQESATGVSSIAQNIKVVSQSANETSVGAHQILTAAQSLSQLASNLGELVKNIKI